MSNNRHFLPFFKLYDLFSIHLFKLLIIFYYMQNKSQHLFNADRLRSLEIDSLILVIDGEVLSF